LREIEQEINLKRLHFMNWLYQMATVWKEMWFKEIYFQITVKKFSSLKYVLLKFKNELLGS
jgi:diacylglycerol kinase family enzyme